MSTTNTAETRDALLPCAKCDGKGKLDCFAHYADGNCFACGGTGRVRVQNYNWLKSTMHTLRYSYDIAMMAEIDGNADRRDHYLRGMLDDMFKIGTDNAREILGEIRTGRYHDECNGRGYRTEVAPAGVGPAVAARLIELGREAKVAA